MNIKLHTPKSLKAGSGMGSLRQFLLSLLATTVSIVLTFGTAAIIDNNKKEREKHEIVMMVMYDMSNTLQSVGRADSIFRQLIDIQLRLAKDTSQFRVLAPLLYRSIPVVQYTETTERIFSSSIESINTVGSVLFTESVAKFYKARKNYSTNVCDSLMQSLSREKPFSSLKKTLAFNCSMDVCLSGLLFLEMQQQFAECKQMMNISDDELEQYRMERNRIEGIQNGKNAGEDSITNEIIQHFEEYDEAIKKLNLNLE